MCFVLLEARVSVEFQFPPLITILDKSPVAGPVGFEYGATE